MKSFLVFAALLLACSVLAQEHPTTTKMLRKLGKSQAFNQKQIDNARDILQACVPYTTDERMLAYVLSTAIGESGLYPIKEYRAAEGTWLWDVQNRYWYTGYYGRGYVQLTWESNYAKFGQLLGIDLVGNPDLALNPYYAGQIICIGMYRGLFTGVSLQTYFTAGGADWVNARRIVNGVDKAQQFADRAYNIYVQ